MTASKISPVPPRNPSTLLKHWHYISKTMSYKLNPEKIIHVGTSIASSPNSKEYFCTIGSTALTGGKSRPNSNDPSEIFVEIHITKKQALALYNKLKQILETEIQSQSTPTPEFNQFDENSAI